MAKTAFVLGGGGWGTALAGVLAESFDTVWVWEHDPAYALEMQQSRENTRYLPGVKLPDAIRVTSQPDEMASAELLVLSVPSSFHRDVWAKALKFSHGAQVAVIATKGIEPGSLMTMCQAAQEECEKIGVKGPHFVTLSGPSHAEEVGRKLATTVVVAGDNAAATQAAQAAFNRDWFRVYTSPDHLGVELGGSLKNVVALAAGIADGLGLGDNAKAALITRGLAEMTRLGVAMGAQASTFSGLSGVGDLVVTCMSKHSRNRSVGERLGKGETWAEIDKTFKQAVEGAVTARSAMELAARYKVDLPIAQAVHSILYQGKDAKAAMGDLLRRPTGAEA
jgi:glycerol-3-phosphate dehydrogenase (NAD(P)+)